jgi:hypothetical protein
VPCLNGIPCTLDSVGAIRVFSGATGSLLYTVTGGALYRRIGLDVRMIGDVDGDGRSDFAAVANTWPTPCCPPGLPVLVFRGSDGSLMSVLPLQWGAGCDGAGDVNGDGVPDIVVGGSVLNPGNSGRVWVYSLGNVPHAAAIPVGLGCGPGGTPILTADGLPVLGQSMVLNVGSPMPNIPGALVLSLPPPTPVAIGPGCFVWVDPASFLLVSGFNTGSAGMWTGTFPISADVALAGLILRVQAALTPSGATLPLLTNALDLKLGYL